MRSCSPAGVGRFIALAGFFLTSPTAAQSPTAELGIDAAVQIAIPEAGDLLTTVEVPLGRIRAGAYAGSRWLIELGVGYALASQSDRTASAGRADLSLAYHLGSDARRPRPFFALGGGGRVGWSDGNSIGQALVFGGLGIKAPFDRVVALRLEVDYARAFSTPDLEAAHEIRGLVGLSFLLGAPEGGTSVRR